MAVQLLVLCYKQLALFLGISKIKQQIPKKACFGLRWMPDAPESFTFTYRFLGNGALLNILDDLGTRWRYLFQSGLDVRYVKFSVPLNSASLYQ